MGTSQNDTGFHFKINPIIFLKIIIFQVVLENTEQSSFTLDTLASEITEMRKYSLNFMRELH